MPPRLGAHLSIAGGFDRAVDRAVAHGCDALQVFTRNSNQWAARPIAADEAARFRERVAGAGLQPVLAHTSYLINVGTADDTLWSRSLAALAMEVERAAVLGIPYLVLHPGAHVGAGAEAGLDRIAAALDEVHARSNRQVTILLENTAGQGTCLGCRWEELRSLADRLREPGRVGFCLDTAHTFAAGYDIATAEGWRATWDEAARVLGWENVRAVHVNDSKKPLGSRVDRHEQIGLGLIGPGAFHRLMTDPRFDGLVATLETEKEEDGLADEQNLFVLRQLASRDAGVDDVRAWRDEARRAFIAKGGVPVAPATKSVKAVAKKVTKKKTVAKKRVKKSPKTRGKA